MSTAGNKYVVNTVDIRQQEEILETLIISQLWQIIRIPGFQHIFCREYHTSSSCFSKAQILFDWNCHSIIRTTDKDCSKKICQFSCEILLLTFFISLASFFFSLVVSLLLVFLKRNIYSVLLHLLLLLLCLVDCCIDLSTVNLFAIDC